MYNYWWYWGRDLNSINLLSPFIFTPKLYALKPDSDLCFHMFILRYDEKQGFYEF